jgi:hypothetical protein
MSIIGLCVLVPINIAATRATGDWPPVSGSIDFLSISGINLQGGRLREDPNLYWYWSPFVATWLFSLLTIYFMHDMSEDYISTREYFFEAPENKANVTSLMVSGVPESMRSDEKLKEWVESTESFEYPIQEAMIGRDNLTLFELIEKHEAAVRQLEITLASYLGGMSIKSNTLHTN